MALGPLGMGRSPWRSSAGRAGTLRHVRTPKTGSIRFALRGPDSEPRLGTRALLSDDGRAAGAENQLGLVLVVAPTAKGDVGDGGRPVHRIGLDVVELQERALRASPPGGGHEGALAMVAPPDRALDFPRNVAGGHGGFASFLIRPGTDGLPWFRLGTDRPVSPQLVCRPELRLLDLVEQHGEGAVEDRARIAVRDLAAEKGLDAP